MKPTPLIKPYSGQRMDDYLKNNINKMVDGINYGIIDPQGDGKTTKASGKVISVIRSGGTNASAVVETNNCPFKIETKVGTANVIQVYHPQNGVNYDNAIQAGYITYRGKEYAVDKDELTVSADTYVFAGIKYDAATDVFTTGLYLSSSYSDGGYDFFDRIGYVFFSNSKIKNIERYRFGDIPVTGTC